MKKTFFLANWSHLCGINEPPVWDLWTTSENPVIFKSNTANSSKNRDFNIAYSVEQIGDFCNPNPARNFHWVFRSDLHPVDLSEYLIQSDYVRKKILIKHFTALINAVWISISDPVEFFRNPLRSGSSSGLRNPVVSRSRSRIMVNTDSLLQDFSLQCSLYNVAITNDRM